MNKRRGEGEREVESLTHAATVKGNGREQKERRQNNNKEKEKENVDEIRGIGKWRVEGDRGRVERGEGDKEAKYCQKEKHKNVIFCTKY